MIRFIQDFEALVGARAHDELSRVRSVAESLIERLKEQAENAEGDFKAEIEKATAGAESLIADIDAVKGNVENLTLAGVRELHGRAQEIGLV